MQKQLTLLKAGVLLLLSGFVSTPSTAQDMTIAAWPKIELHLHLDCSLSYKVVHDIDPSITPEQYQHNFIAPGRCTNLADYITRAVQAIALMQTKEQLRLVTLDLFDQLQKDHVVYAEMRFAPLQHLQKGLTPTEVVAAVNAAVVEGIQKTGIRAGVILCTLRHYTEAQSMETVRLVQQFKNTHIVGFDIAADEAGYPITNHTKAFQYANAHGIPCTAHAGEAKGPQSVWETVQNFHPSRIGHGVRSIEDTSLIAFLKKKHIHLEICPTSNTQTNIYADIAQHPADQLYRTGVSMSINTDGRTISNTSLQHEYSIMQNLFHWNRKQFLACNLEAVDHAFTDGKTKKQLRDILVKGYALK
jgi:adenosine deaminase